MLSYQITRWGAPLLANEAPTPEPTGTEVLLAVDACGVCHTDLHIWDGYFDLGDGQKATLEERGVNPPFTMGHEIVGRVAAVGPEASGIAVGDPCVAYPWIGCGACDVCAAEQDLLCLAPRYLGTRVHGGYADHVLVPDPKYLFSYAGIDPHLAATYACSGLTAFSALKKTLPLAASDTLLIIGAGGVGLNAIHIAPALTDAKLLVADIDPAKRAAASAAGAWRTVDNAAADAAAQIIEITGGGVAAAIDFVGAPATTELGLACLRRGGRHIIVGLYGSALSVSLPTFPFKQMTMRGSFTGSRPELEELLDLARAGRIKPLPVASRPMAQVNQTLNDLKNGQIVGRVVLTNQAHS